MVEVKRTTLLDKRRKEDRKRQRKTRHVKRLKGLDPFASTSSPNAYAGSLKCYYHPSSSFRLYNIHNTQ